MNTETITDEHLVAEYRSIAKSIWTRLDRQAEHQKCADLEATTVARLRAELRPVIEEMEKRGLDIA